MNKNYRRSAGWKAAAGDKTRERMAGPRMRDKKEEQKKEEWEIALAEVDLPEPAEGGKIITFSLPVTEEKPVKPRVMKKAPETAAESTTKDFTAYNREDYAGLSDSPRRRAREAALLLLFSATSGGDWNTAENILQDTAVSGENRTFALDLAQTAYQELTENDQLLARYARDWDVERFSSVDRCILRLALAELRRENPEDHTIVINEAIELGKKFGSEESGAFINAMLDNIARQEFSVQNATPRTDI